MRLIVISSLIISLVTSCYIQKTIPIKENLFLLDFLPYTNQGFLFTTEGFSEPYESIGMIEYRFMTSSKTEEFAEYGFITIWVDDQFIIQDGLEIVYGEVAHLGADALINLEVISIESSPNKNANNALYEPSGYIIRGFAIDRVN